MVNEKTLIEATTSVGSGGDKLFGLLGIYLLRWNTHCNLKLESAEDKLFSTIKSPCRRYYVNLQKCVDDDDKIWTLEMNEKNKNVPIVLLHGFGAGLGFWIHNLEALAKNHHVYAFDILGLARSSRPNFSNDALEIEQEFVRSIERWRMAMNIEKFVFVAHSWGAFLASSYALLHADKIEHLILIDPWGFDKFQDMTNFPWWKLAAAYGVRLFEGCFSLVRIFGPFGPYLIKCIRPDLLKKFDTVVEPSVMLEYIYHCVNNTNPTGECAFHRMTTVGPWPLYPIGERMKMIDDDLPITFLYGEGSWTSKEYGYIIKGHRGVASYTDVCIIPKAGHHIHADNPEEFHRVVLNACKTLRSNR